MRPALTVNTITDDAAFQALEPEWNALLQQTAADTLFLTWEWISTWWRAYGGAGQLHVLTARNDEGALVGAAPLKRVRRRFLGVWPFDTIEFIGSGTDVIPDYLDLMVMRGLEAQVVPEFVNQLRSRRAPAAVDLRPVPAQSATLRALTAALGDHSTGRVRRVPFAVCPVAMLPPTAEEFVAGCSRNYRKKLGEYTRRCRRDLSAEFRVSDGAAQVTADLDELMRLHHRRWGARSRAFRTGAYRRFHHDLAQLLGERGWLRMMSLNISGRPIALLYCFAYGRRFYYYQGGWDPEFARYRVGLVLMHMAVLQAIQEGALVFDFLRGEEAYKNRWATTRIGCERLTFWSGAAVRAASNGYDLLHRVIRHPWRGTVAPAPTTHLRS